MIIGISILFAFTFTGLGFVLIRAISDGLEIYGDTYSESTSREFEDLFLFIPPKRIKELSWAGAIAMFLVMFFVTGSLTSLRGAVTGLIVGTIFGGLALRAPTFLLAILRRRRLHRFNLQLGDTLVSMSNALRAGFSLPQTFETVVRDGENPISQEFDVFLQQTRVGVSFSDALSDLQTRVDSEDLQLVVVAIETARKTGGNLTEIFDRIAATIRERLRIEQRIRTLTAQGRLQGIIVGLMPIIIAVALMIVDPEMMRPFLHSRVGVVTLSAVAILIAIGGFFIRKIVRIDI